MWRVGGQGRNSLGKWGSEMMEWGLICPVDQESKRNLTSEKKAGRTRAEQVRYEGHHALHRAAPPGPSGVMGTLALSSVQLVLSWLHQLDRTPKGLPCETGLEVSTSPLE
jgi:hypothetical protein